MGFDEAHKRKVEQYIVDVIATALDKNELKEDELPKIGNFVLSKIDNIKTHKQLLEFLNELSQNWKIFSNIEEIEKGEEKEFKEETVEKGIIEMAKKGKIDEALKLAKTVDSS